MRTGLLHNMRRNHGHVAVAMLFALLLPLLLGILPQPALSATAQLERDLAQSWCSPDGQGPDQQDHADHNDCCILCPVGASVSIVLKDVTPPAAPPALSGLWIVVEAPAETLAWRSELTRIVPRGPPAA